MNYRTAIVLAQKDVDEAGTEIIPIRIKDIISRITITFQATKSKHSMDDNGYANITKIELIDGSDVLHSMSGGENQALCIYDRKCGSMNNGEHQDGSKEYDVFGIDFGRYLYDPELAFDPAKFNNPQLKITYDENVSDTGCEENGLTVWADCFDEKVVSPIGFLMSKEHWSGVKPTTGYEYIALPTDFPIRKMLVRAYKAAYSPTQLLGGVRIDEDNEKRIPFDWDNMHIYQRHMARVWTPVTEKIITWTFDTGNQIYVLPTCYFEALALTPYYSTTAYISGAHAAGGAILIRATGAGRQVGGIVSGFLPCHCIEFPFGLQDDLDDWYDVTRLGSCRLRLRAGETDMDSAGVVLQQLRRY